MASTAAALDAARRATMHALDALERAVRADVAQLATDRRLLEADRAAFTRTVEDKAASDAEEKQRIRAAAPPPGDVIRLNVGGARFETSRAVLTKVEDSMLGRMFGRCDSMLQTDPLDGSVFIDRDGERFRVILDFLRGDPPEGAQTQKALRLLSEAAHALVVQELDYFGLVTAVFGLRPWTDHAIFRNGPAMSSGRSTCAAVAVGERLVVFGGLLGEQPLGTTEILDVETMIFRNGPNLLAGRSRCAAVLIDADRVLVVGGCSGGALRSSEIFHLSTLTFSPGPLMATGRSGCAAVALDSRRILVVGGYSGTACLSSTEIFSLETMTFTPGPSMLFAREGAAAVVLEEHRIIVVGGCSGTGEALSGTDILDIRTMTFLNGPKLASARSFCAAVKVDAGHVLVLGGQNLANALLATSELLDVSSLTFAPGPQMASGRSGIAAARLDENEAPRIFVLGGDVSTTAVLAVDATGARAVRRRQYP